MTTEILDKESRLKAAEAAFHSFMDALGLDFKDDNFTNTPHRVAKMFINETCKGLFEKTEDLKITTFANKNQYGGMVVVKDIEVHSLCAHHFQNFDGHCTIAYIPGEKVVGLSKFSRIVDHFSRRPQTQEFLLQEIFDYVKEILGTENVAITMECEHNCMKVRGVEEPCATTATALMGGLFLHSEATRNEFLFHCKK